MRRFAVLAAALIGASAAMFSVLSVNQAIANIQAELPLVDLEPRWILNAYLVALSVPMLAAGALGDRFGRRSVLLWGSLLFAGASAAVALVENVDHLIAVRAVQGIGAALLVPSTLSTLSDAFPDGSSRGFSVGLWAALSTVAFAAGPITGVWILEQGHNWRWFFYVNAIAGALAFLLGMAAPKVRGYSGRHLDVSGLLLGTLGIGLLAYALVEGNFTGWRQELTAGALLAGAFFLVVFLLVESHKSNSMVLLPLSNSGTFPAANAVATMNFLALLGISVFLPTYFRNLLGYPTDVSFLRLVPFAGLILVVAPVAGMVSEKAGSRLLMTFGNLLAAGGLGLLLQARLQADYESDVLPALVLMGFGFALSVGPLTTATVGVVQDFHAGGASGATGSARLIGILLGIGLLGAVVMTAFRNGLAADLAAAGIDTATAQRVAESPEAAAVLGGGSFEPLRNTLAPGTPPNVGDQVLGVARDSFLDAVNTGMLMSIGFLLLAAVIALIFVRSHVISLFRVESEKSPPEGRAPVEPTPAAAAVPASDPEPTPRVVELPPPGEGEVAEKP
ncbi:MAG TPA: MFS transporter, partial [Actinomycetota bacterium]|nr:MFS transporter [Actinomycetota bacterium]